MITKIPTSLIAKNLIYLDDVKKNFSKAFSVAFEEGYYYGLEKIISVEFDNPFHELKNIELNGAEYLFDAFFKYFNLSFEEFQSEKLEAYDYDLEKILDKYQKIFKIMPALEAVKKSGTSVKDQIQATENIFNNNIRFYVHNDIEREELNKLKNHWHKLLKDFSAGYEDGYKFGISEGFVSFYVHRQNSGEIFLEENRQRTLTVDIAFLQGYNDSILLLDVERDNQNLTVKKTDFTLNYVLNFLDEEISLLVEDDSFDNNSFELLAERYRILLDLRNLLKEKKLFFDRKGSADLPDLFFEFLEGLNIVPENMEYFNNLICNKLQQAFKSYTEGSEQVTNSHLVKNKAVNNNFKAFLSGSVEKLCAGSKTKLLIGEQPEILKKSETVIYEPTKSVFSGDFLIYDTDLVLLDFKEEVILEKVLPVVPQQAPNQNENHSEKLTLPVHSLRNTEDQIENYKNQNTNKFSYLTKIFSFISPVKKISRVSKLIKEKNQRDCKHLDISITQEQELREVSKIDIQAVLFNRIAEGFSFNISTNEFKLEPKLLGKSNYFDSLKLSTGLDYFNIESSSEFIF